MAHRLAAQPKEPHNRICFGTPRASKHLHDVQQLGYIDARLPHGTMTPEEIAIWTGATARRIRATDHTDDTDRAFEIGS